jgi:hypothetical protein
MRAHFIDAIAFAALAGLAVSPAPALAADCDEGSAEARIACLQVRWKRRSQPSPRKWRRRRTIPMRSNGTIAWR